MTQRKYAIWDIDNCTADDRARVPLIDWHLEGNERYMRYNEFMANDPPANVETFELFKELGFEPVFFTGRPELYLSQTQEFLHGLGEYGYSFVDGRDDYQLFMRGNDERLTPADLKQRMLRDFLKTHDISSIVAAFDDHEGIVRMYRSHGIPAVVLKVHDVPVYNAADQADAQPLTL